MKIILITIVLLINIAALAGIKNNISHTVYEIPTILDKVQIDGSTNEAAWSTAETINTFYNSKNAEQIKIDANISTLFDSKNLIFRINIPNLKSGTDLKKCYLSDEYDLRMVPNISIYLDPSHGHGSYYRFIIDSNGNKQDLRVDDESWYAEWAVAINQTDDKFNAEIKIPLDKISEKIDDGTIWGFNITIDGIDRHNTLSTTPITRRLADAVNFGHILFKGNMNNEQLGQCKSSILDFHKEQKETKILANIAMCGTELIEIGGEIKNISVGNQLELKNGAKVECIGLDNEKIIRSNFSFFYEKYENKQLQLLRKQYNLEEIITPGKNDFEKLLLLNEWLFEHIEFGTPPPIRPNALQILHHGLNGQTFYCTYLSFTLMQMYTSLGYTARKLTSVGHGTLDVWSNYWHKWIQIDPSRRSYFRLKKSAIPLNSNEIRREFWKNKGIDMEMVYGTEQRAEKVTLEVRERDGNMRYRPDSYKWVAYKSRNNFFEVPFAYWNYDYLIIEDEYNSKKTWMNGGKTDIREILGTKTNRIGDVFWTLNQAYIHIYDEGTNNLIVQLETVTPNFETFEYSIDEGNWYKTEENSINDGQWRKTEPLFKWALHKGQNLLRTRSVNKFGVRGPEYKMVLKM